MVLHKLNAGVVVGGVELIRDVPAQGAKLAAFLHHGVEYAQAKQHLVEFLRLKSEKRNIYQHSTTTLKIYKSHI